MQSLVRLTITQNELHSIPQNLFSLPTLNYVDLSYNYIQSVDLDDLSKSSVKELILSCNRIEDVHFSPAHTPSAALEILDLSGNLFVNIPPFPSLTSPHIVLQLFLRNSLHLALHSLD